MNTNRMITILCLLLAFSFAAAAMADDPPPSGDDTLTWDLESVFRKVLAENEWIARASSDVAKADAGYRGARSRIVPNLTFNGSLTRYDQAQIIDFGETEEGDPVGFEVVPETDWSYMVNLRQILYAGGRPTRALRLMNNLRDVSRQGYEQVRQQVLLTVAASYLEILKAERSLEINRASLELAQKQLSVSESLFRAGEVVRTSVLRSELAVVTAERGVIEAENRVARAREDFAVFTGIRGEYRLESPDPPPDEIPDLEALLARAGELRPEMRMSDLDIINAELQVEIARGELLPVLTADVNYIQQKSRFPTDRWFSGILGLSFPIFDGGLALSHKREAEQDLIQAGLRRKELEKQIRSEVTRSRLAWEEMKKTRTVVVEQVALAHRTYEDITTFYAVGEATDLDQLSALQTLVSSEQLLSDVENDMVLASYAVDASIGAFARDLKPAGAEGESSDATVE